MKMGYGLALASLGAILRYAVDDNWDGVDLGVVGLILIIVGSVAFVTSAALEFTKRSATQPATPSVASSPPPSPPPAATPNPPQPH
jgi:CO dehydrogenase/acetyl-CoA synthase epsilon subunit